MIKGFILLFLFYFITAASFAQSSYVPFPEGEAVWHVGYVQPDYGVGVRHNQYSYAGDTTINGINCHKLSYKVEWVGPGGDSLDNGIIGYLSQDSLAKKVYYMPIGDTARYLLYDFDLQLGSLYPQTFTHYINDTASVTKIDSIPLGNSFRRVFIFGAGLLSDTLKLIEGIGANAGLLSPAVSGYCFENCWWLSCFQQEGESLYSEVLYSFAPLCNLVSVSEQNQSQNNYNLLPNPVIRGNDASLTLSPENKIEVSICDMFGNIIWTEKINHQSSLKIPTKNLFSGMYLVKILVDDQFISNQKLVVQ